MRNSILPPFVAVFGVRLWSPKVDSPRLLRIWDHAYTHAALFNLYRPSTSRA